jgi:Spy/CpxP family protein refolding chaperone
MEFNPANRKALSLLVLVFVLGIALGAVGHMLAQRKVLAQAHGHSQGGGPGAQQGRLVGRMKDDLKLSDDQQKQITQILADMQRTYDGIREQMGPQFDQARNEGRDRIRQVLTPEQRPGFDDFMRRVDEERSKRGYQGGPPGHR